MAVDLAKIVNIETENLGPSGSLRALTSSSRFLLPEHKADLSKKLAGDDFDNATIWYQNGPVVIGVKTERTWALFGHVCKVTVSKYTLRIPA